MYRDHIHTKMLSLMNSYIIVSEHVILYSHDVVIHCCQWTACIVFMRCYWWCCQWGLIDVHEMFSLSSVNNLYCCVFGEAWPALPVEASSLPLSVFICFHCTMARGESTWVLSFAWKQHIRHGQSYWVITALCNQSLSYQSHKCSKQSHSHIYL